MKPVKFNEVNKELGKPSSMHDDECGSLPVLQINNSCISCWEFTDEEIEMLTKNKKIWIGVLSGQTQPPIFLSVIEPVDVQIARDIQKSQVN